MPHIRAIATTVPKHEVAQAEAQEFARRLFSPHLPHTDRLLSVFQNAGIQTRYFCRPPEWFAQPRSLGEKNDTYIESATALGAQATRSVCELAGIELSEIDYIIYVNTTGLATPSIDARLFNILGFRPDIRRTPIWGLGCAGGVAGLSHAHHHLLGHPGQRVLFVAVELCGLTFVSDDYSPSNLVASALFGEGAAAVLVEGDDIRGAGPEISSTRSRIWPDSLDVMGWNFGTKGLQVVFAQRIPDIVREHARTDLEAFLAGENLQPGDVRSFVFHPGGKKVLEAYQEALDLPNSQLAVAWEILRQYGNMSSVTVLFVLERFLAQHGDGSGPVLVSALGPGFSSESVLLRI